jgi:RHS repeat-associated protein
LPLPPQRSADKGTHLGVAADDKTLTATFKYDPFGRRIYKSSSSATSVYGYDGDNLVEEANGTGTVVARYEQTQNIDEPLAMLRSATTSYYHADGLGSVTSLSNSAGSIANTYTYDSFGKLTASTGSLVNPFQYTARESDSESGLYYYRARYYDSSAGRFITEDPARFAAGIDFYSYVKNNPVIFNDPFGWQPNSCGGTTDCNKYKQLRRYDLYLICQLFPNDPKSNCIRLCLQQNFGAGSHGVGSYFDPPLGSTALIGGDAANVLGQAYGPITHLMCFKKCGLF